VSPLSLTRRIALGLMHPNQVARPFHRDGWIYEEKVDGWRMLAVKADGTVRLISRNGLDHTRRFPELVKDLIALKPKTFTLDGEVAVYDQALISRFEWLRARPKDEPATLPVYMVFDVLELGARICGASRCESGGGCFGGW
jgi:bifunctional non-homologous end joining protein LigD